MKNKIIGGLVALLVLIGVGASHTSPTTQSSTITPVAKTAVQGESTTATTTDPVTPAPSPAPEQQAVTVTPAAPATPAPVPTPAPTPTPVPDSSLSNDSSYVNSDGNTVHSPASTADGSVPAGATARCRDGAYSFSQHRQGTCSGHDGVATWL